MTLWEHLLGIALYAGTSLFLAVAFTGALRTGKDNCLAVGLFLALGFVGIPAFVMQVAAMGVLPSAAGPRQFMSDVFRDLSGPTSLTVALSWAMFCGGLLVGYYPTRSRVFRKLKGGFEIDLRRPETVLVLCAIAVLALYFWSGLGYSFADRYEMLRIARTFARPELSVFQASVFSLIFSALLLTTFVAFGIPFRTHGAAKVLVWCFILLFAFLLASRRALILPLVLTYLTSALYAKKIFAPQLIAAGFACFLLVMFGKEIIGGYSPEYLATQITNIPGVLFRVAADVGVSHVCSLATVQQIETPMRFGIDHLFSVVRKLPDGVFGLDLGLPERIVRTTTLVFAGPDQDDIPPGLLGQAWLDFRWAGGAIYGVVFGVMLGCADRVMQLIERSRWQIMLCVVVAFLVSMPLHTGSLDYLLGIESFILAILIALCFQIKRPINRISQSDTIIAERHENKVGVRNI